jgi:methionyl aminopeptidase
MTEKHYGGTSSHGLKKDIVKSQEKKPVSHKTSSKNLAKIEIAEASSVSETETNYLNAGKIASQVVAYAKSIIKPGMTLLEIAEKVESKIVELGGKPAFPVNLSINEIAAHDTPAWNDTRVASGLLKVDIGVHIKGCSADTAFSLNLENDEENTLLIEAAELGLEHGISAVKNNSSVTLSQIGKAIETAIKAKGFQPIQNLSGHSIEEYDLHSGITIPNIDNNSNKTLDKGCIAIEPFSTNGLGKVRDGRPSGIFSIQKPGNVRDNFAREVLEFIADEYQTLPFCSRWIQKRFGSRGLLALRQIEQAGILHSYPQLIEVGNGKVAQAEHTILITDKDKIVTTE